jgi:hypothetical protein
MTIRIETDCPVIITTERSVSIQTVGGVSTVVINGAMTGTPHREHAGPDLIDLGAPDGAEDLLPRTKPLRSDKPRCGEMMKRSGQPCARVAGHNGVHMNAVQVARKQSYNARRARERYAADPDYAEHVRAQVRASSRKKGEG